MIDYHELRVWKKSRDLVLAIYRATAAFPADERYGLTAQLRRAAVSVVSNIAEGAGRNSPGEMTRFVSFAAGSSSEVECQIEIARDLDYLDAGAASALIDQVGDIRKMLSGLLLAGRRRPRLRDC